MVRRTQLTDEWKARAREAMRTSGRTAKEIAAEMDVAPPTLVHMLDPQYGQQSSRHAVALSKILGIAAPTAEVTGTFEERWLEMARRLRARNPDLADNLMEKFEAQVEAAEAAAIAENHEAAATADLSDLLEPPKKP
jgi:transposase-like protein